MAKYRWRGKDRFQNRVTGNIIADNAQQARQRLYQQGINVLSLSRNWQLLPRITLVQQAEFFLQFSLLLKAEIPLKQALQMLQAHCHNEKLYQLLTHCLHQLNIGLPLSTALQTEQQFLSNYEWQLLYSGERSGQLSAVIQQLAESKKRQAALQQQIKKIIFYPVMMLSISLLLTIFLLLFIVPTFADLYSQQQQSLPWLTQFLLTISQFLQHYLIYLCIVMPLLCFGMYQCYLRLAIVKNTLLRVLCLIPSINKIFLTIQSIQFFSILSTMLQAGITLQQSLNSFFPQSTNFAASYNHSLLAKEARQCLQALQQGLPFSNGLSYRFISQQTRQMIIIGEQSGKLTHILCHLTEHNQQQLSAQIELAAKLLEPLLMLIIGSIIGIIIMGMYLPIFNLGNVIL
ncbi:type II secretion system F family protein [Gallibacterium salpingitidis]|uniref:type II secretion system F family protein n=1 Tax=Gallibacterium salpingitidis TaxID=505341 RepID=UPI00266FFC79|nr:type II secretion system F family protein [Gallibacterium salpingitidis]WKS98903.1 type II secretion system F family protein [Gallibacterium salpingitidis]